MLLHFGLKKRKIIVRESSVNTLTTKFKLLLKGKLKMTVAQNLKALVAEVSKLEKENARLTKQVAKLESKVGGAKPAKAEKAPRKAKAVKAAPKAKVAKKAPAKKVAPKAAKKVAKPAKVAKAKKVEADSFEL